MMPHGGDTPSKPAITTATKDHENQSSDGRRITTTKPPEQGLKCPRCDSPNTKFCYYNNYSLTQPRHFCKTCRRYWTKGGALRNVPIGGGCRKSKKGIKPSSSASSSLSSRSLSCDSGGSSSDQLSSLKFLHGLSTPLDFHLGGLTFPSSSRLQQQQQLHLPIATGFYNNQFSSSFGDLSASSSATSSVSGFQLLDPSSAGGSSSLIGLNYPFSSSTGSGLFSSGGAIQGVNMNVNSLNVHSSLASSIESLSSLNQDLHWKLQQQRLAMLFGGENQKDDNNNNNSVSFSPVVNLENQTTLQRPQPILFQNLEISKPSAAESGFLVGDSSSSRKEGINGGDTDTTPTEWFFGNSYASVAPTPTSTSSGGGGNNGHDNNASNNWGGGSGVHAWGDVQQQPYSALP